MPAAAVPATVDRPAADLSLHGADRVQFRDDEAFVLGSSRGSGSLASCRPRGGIT